MKSVRSKSSRSVKSMRSVKSAQEPSIPEEKTMEIEDYIKIGCQRFYCPYHIQVVRESLRDHRIKKQTEPSVKHKKITVVESIHSTHDNDGSDTPVSGRANLPEPVMYAGELVVTATHDHSNQLVELSLAKVKEVPRVFMQVIGLLVPYFTHLNKISIKASRIDKYTIYEMHKLLPLSTITEICLDDSFLPEANYAILLDGNSPVRSLSLSRCSVNDAVCKQIVSRLRYMESGEPNLCVLNLSSNHITDEGAKHIGGALRTNRHLRYLNLADNRVTDDGACHIFNVLAEFPLTYKEILEKRRRYTEYLRAKQAMYAKCLHEFDSKSVDESKRSTSKRKSKPTVPSKSKAIERRENSYSDDNYTLRAEVMAAEMLGQYQDPFGPGNVKLKDGYSHCIGNMTLCYLNLSYNSLSYMSVKKLLDIVNYQQLNKMKTGQSGLMKLMIDGNNMPVTCSEMVTLNDILQRNMNCVGRSYAASTRRKSAKLSAFPTPERSVVLL